MSREYASPELANLIAAPLSPDEIDRRARAPLTEAEVEEIAELVDWFTRRYPTARDRLAYARRKLRQIVQAGAHVDTPASEDEFLGTARRLARAHRATDPRALHVLVDPDPARREIRLLEVTEAVSTTEDPSAVSFLPRADLGIPFVVTILLLSPARWDAVGRGEAELPDGWSASRLVAL